MEEFFSSKLVVSSGLLQAEGSETDVRALPQAEGTGQT